jgi:hypothetical protein
MIEIELVMSTNNTGEVEMRLVKRGYKMPENERKLYAIYRYEEVNMHYCQWERRCSVGWAQNDTLRFFGPDSGDGPCWGSRAFDYGAYLKKRGLALPESYNYNPFDLMKPPAKRTLALVGDGQWHTWEELMEMDDHPTVWRDRIIAAEQLGILACRITGAGPLCQDKLPFNVTARQLAQQDNDDIALT